MQRNDNTEQLFLRRSPEEKPRQNISKLSIYEAEEQENISVRSSFEPMTKGTKEGQKRMGDQITSLSQLKRLKNMPEEPKSPKMHVVIHGTPHLNIEDEASERSGEENGVETCRINRFELESRNCISSIKQDASRLEEVDKNIMDEI